MDAGGRNLYGAFDRKAHGIKKSCSAASWILLGETRIEIFVHIRSCRFASRDFQSLKRQLFVIKYSIFVYVMLYCKTSGSYGMREREDTDHV